MAGSEAAVVTGFQIFLLLGGSVVLILLFTGGRNDHR